MTSTDSAAEHYVNSCTTVIACLNACLDAANSAIGAHRMAAQPSQHPTSIQNFTRFAEQSEREFDPLLREFQTAMSAAREAADAFRDRRDPLEASQEILLAFGNALADEVALATRVLSSDFGQTSEAFVGGVVQVNAQLNEPSQRGFIYVA